MATSTALMVASAYLPGVPRLIVWAVLVAGWIVVLLLMGRSRIALSRGVTPTDSLVERFGTFTIIVLGEVVFGVVEGLSRATRDLETIFTGMIALVVGFGLVRLGIPPNGEELGRSVVFLLMTVAYGGVWLAVAGTGASGLVRGTARGACWAMVRASSRARCASRPTIRPSRCGRFSAGDALL
jgi:hypothetical protein